MSEWRAGSAEDRRIRSLRPPRPAVDTAQPIKVLFEEERLGDGSLASTITVFLAGRECPFTCVYCDLWRFTTAGPTPPGAIPSQLKEAFDRTVPNLPPPVQAKLYNASNFFDEHAVPSADDPAILRQLNRRRFERVTVECHPRLVGPRAFDFARGLKGRLQVAMGLETVHRDALPKLNKKLTLEDFDRAAAALADAGLGIRAFVLLGTPFVPPEETLTWTLRSAVHAVDRGAEHVAIVPVRSGPGEMERLEREGLFREPRLEEIEEAIDRCLELQLPGTVTVDVWDLERFARCPECFEARRERLLRINKSGQSEPAAACGSCG